MREPRTALAIEGGPRRPRRSGARDLDGERAGIVGRRRVGELERERGSLTGKLQLVDVIAVVTAPLVRAAAIDGEPEPHPLEFFLRDIGVGEGKAAKASLPKVALVDQKPTARS